MGRLNNERGIAILFTLFSVIILSVFGAAFVVRSVTENRVALKHELSTRAFWLAEAGMQRGIWEVESNNCTGLVQCGTATACTSCTDCGSGDKCLAGSLTHGDYDLTLNSANTLLTSVGSYPNRSVSSRVRRTVQTTVAGSSLFSYAAFAENSVTLSNNATIDSFDSSLGTYAATSGSNGAIGTNGTANGAATLNNNVTVEGDVSSGVNGGSGSIAVGSNVNVTGTMTTGVNDVDLAAVSAPSALTGLTANPDSSSASAPKSVGNNASATLTAGNWKFTSLSLSNNATLTIDGDVSLYLTNSSALSTGNNVVINVSAGSSLTLYTAGAISLGNNAVINNVSKTPSDLIIYSSYTGTNGVTLDNNGSIYGAIHAPLTNVSLSNNMDLYGAVVGKNVAIDNNVYIHYDEALSSIQGTGGFTTSQWQEP